MGRQTMEALTTLIGPAAPLLVPNINTDTIAPMYTPATAGQPRAFAMSPEELARRLFANWRYDTQDRELTGLRAQSRAVPPREIYYRRRQFRLWVVARHRAQNARRLRHSLRHRAELSAEFFMIIVSKLAYCRWYLVTMSYNRWRRKPIDGKDFSLDVAAQTLISPAGNTWRFDLPSFRREQLLTGADDIALTLRRNNEIAAYQERERAARPWTFLPPRRIG